MRGARRRILADTAGENDRVRPTHLRVICANVPFDTPAENVNGRRARRS